MAPLIADSAILSCTISEIAGCAVYAAWLDMSQWKTLPNVPICSMVASACQTHELVLIKNAQRLQDTHGDIRRRGLIT